MIQIELNPGDTLCKQGDISNDIYLLQDGKLEVFVKDKRGREKIISEISAKHSIFGEVGAILNKPRGASVHAVQHSVIQKIEMKNRGIDEAIMRQPKLGLSISHNLARYLKDTNVRLSQYTQLLNDIRAEADDALRYYHRKAKSIGELYEKTKVSWAKTIFDKVRLHPCYAMGEGVSKGHEAIAGEVAQAAQAMTPPEIPADLTNVQEFKPGEIVGREGEEGRNFFILQSGLLEIQVGGRKISEVKEKGAVIGEVSVLVGISTHKFEHRSASILAREPSAVIVIEAAGLENLIISRPHLMLFITKVLSGRLASTNQALVIDDERIIKYLAILDTSNPDSRTLANAYELLRANIHSTAKNKPETEGFAEEIQARLSELKEKTDGLQNRYDELCHKWKMI